ncbi:MAG TPA: ankyrin repeat domain-containing protein [Pyrinomonadaceae bacterium]|nr:ankyrin repeat domain-containing protein [Pyrinomonadaceae bacterium]
MSAQSGIIEAIKTGDLARVNELLEADPTLAASRNEMGVSAIMLATYYGRDKIAEVLLERAVALDIFEAAAVGHTERVKEILRQQPEMVNHYADDGFTALGLASFFCRGTVARLLIEKGADVNAASKNRQQVTPLHSAVSRRQTMIAEALLAEGANPNAKQQAGVTPLHQAAHNGHAEMVKLLLAHGADPHARMDDGRTPLAMAIETGKREVINLLREKDATA